jgi:hypothetical protein
MNDMIIEIMVEVLTILGIATKDVKRGRISELMRWCMFFTILADGPYSEKYFKKLTGNREIEDGLERLDRLTQEEARMASAEQLKMTHSVDDRVRGVGGQVQDVRGDLRDVGNMVQDKLDQANRSLSL